jgi:hypothetical protein
MDGKSAQVLEYHTSAAKQDLFAEAKREAQD